MPTLALYDADCGFCTATAEWAHRRLPVDVEWGPLQSRELTTLGIDPSRALVELPVRTEAGAVRYGHQGIAEILRSGRGRWGWALRAAGAVLGSRLASPAAGAAYRFVAARRHRLPGGSPACELAAQPNTSSRNSTAAG